MGGGQKGEVGEGSHRYICVPDPICYTQTERIQVGSRVRLGMPSLSPYAAGLAAGIDKRNTCQKNI